MSNDTNLCISKVDRTGMKVSRESGAAGQREETGMELASLEEQ